MYYDAKECGKRIKEQIKVMGYTQEAFAESVNISIQHLRNILGGHRNCPHELLVEIACVLDISTDYLLTGKERARIDVRNRLLSVIGDLSQIAKWI